MSLPEVHMFMHRKHIQHWNIEGSQAMTLAIRPACFRTPKTARVDIMCGVESALFFLAKDPRVPVFTFTKFFQCLRERCLDYFAGRSGLEVAFCEIGGGGEL